MMVDYSLDDAVWVDVFAMVQAHANRFGSIQALQDVHVVSQRNPVLFFLRDVVVPGGPSQAASRQYFRVDMQYRLVFLVVNRAKDFTFGRAGIGQHP